MPRLWVHGGDDAVPGDLPGDPPPPVGPVRSLSGLDILPGDQRQQRRGLLYARQRPPAHMTPGDCRNLR
jgi:hypothetical protein